MNKWSQIHDSLQHHVTHLKILQWMTWRLPLLAFSGRIIAIARCQALSEATGSSMTCRVRYPVLPRSFKSRERTQRRLFWPAWGRTQPIAFDYRSWLPVAEMVSRVQSGSELKKEVRVQPELASITWSQWYIFFGKGYWKDVTGNLYLAFNDVTIFEIRQGLLVN